MNRILLGDNLEWMRRLPSDSFDIAYLDPPFMSKRVFTGFDDRWGSRTQEGPESPLSSLSADFHSKGMSNYLSFMIPRLTEAKRLLRPDFSIWLHCDDSASAWLRIAMDSVFGLPAFRNEVIWRRTKSKNNATKKFTRLCDTLLFYSTKAFNRSFLPLEETRRFNKRDEKGVYALAADMGGNKTRPGLIYDLGHGEKTPRWGYKIKEETLRRWIDEGIAVCRPGRVPSRKRYLHESKGIPVSSLWLDINLVKGSSKENTDWPTQKPLKLLERILLSSSDEGDSVLDPFMGSGTTLVAAERHGREWTGIESSEDAVNTAMERLDSDFDFSIL